MSEHRDLALIDTARAALAEARTVVEAKDIHDKAAAVAYYAARKQGSEEAERYATEIRLRAERRIGEIAAQLETAQGKRTDRTSHSVDAKCEPTKAQALEAVGINRDAASKFERIAAIPEKRFEEEVRKPAATTRSLARIGGEYRRPQKAPRRLAPVPVPGPAVSDRILEQRAQMLRTAVERVLRKYVAEWPPGASLSPLVRVLVEISNHVKELQS